MPQTVETPVTVTAPTLVYDGLCGFCSRSVQFILRHERRHDLLFVPRDSPLGTELRRQFHLEAVESMLWVDGGNVAIESGAVLHAARYLGGLWSALAAIGSLIPAPLRKDMMKTRASPSTKDWSEASFWTVVSDPVKRTGLYCSSSLSQMS